MSNKYTLVLRTCTKDMTGTHERGRAFVWPRKGHVRAPDWDPTPECGHGLHGLAWGEGGASYLSYEPDAVWLVVRVLTASLVWIDGDKVKYPEGTVVHAGDRPSATRYLWEHGGSAHKIVRLSMTGGYESTLTGGYWSTLTWRYHDGDRRRIHTVYVGEGGIKPNVPYLGSFKEGKFVVEEHTDTTGGVK